MSRAAVVIVLVALAACSRSESPNANATPTPTPTPTPNANANANADANANAKPITAAPTPPSTWSGHYTAIPGTLSSPDRFHGDDASVGLGDGAITLALDDHGRAIGTLDGALGATKLDGALLSNDFSAALVPDDLAGGFTGTAVGTRDGDRIAGTMHLSLPMGNVLREASFTLDRKR